MEKDILDKDILTEQEKQFIRELVKRGVPFIIVGMSAANILGVNAVTQDIDMWFEDINDPGIIEAVNAVGGIYVRPFDGSPPKISSLPDIDIVIRMDGLGSFQDELHQCKEVMIMGTKVFVLSLKQIINSKEASNREKDKMVLPILKDSLKISEDL